MTTLTKLRRFYDLTPDTPLIMKEFGYFTLDRWISEGHIKNEAELREICGIEGMPAANIGGLGWCEAEFFPAFDEAIIENRGEHEVVRDRAGRHVLYFTGRCNGFMPEYLDHPVKDMATWERDVKWRLDKHTPDRAAAITRQLDAVADRVNVMGWPVVQRLIGGYMYLRSLIGPEDLLYKFYDDPALLHDCMERWLDLADHVIAKTQERHAIDELSIAEDICYNHGCLISPAHFAEFLTPYYQQLISNIRRRQPGKTMHIQVDTDGFAEPVIDAYIALGMDYMSPFEAAANNDLLRVAEKYPNLRMLGGMDKRVLAQGRGAIDRMIDALIPPMRRRGGFIPTCDHGVPEEVEFEDYVHFRRRLLEYAS